MIRARKEPPYRFRPVPSVTPRNVRVWVSDEIPVHVQVDAMNRMVDRERAVFCAKENAKERRLP